MNGYLKFYIVINICEISHRKSRNTNAMRFTDKYESLYTSFLASVSVFIEKKKMGSINCRGTCDFSVAWEDNL